MQKLLFIRFGDLLLKGKNKRFFIQTIRKHLQHKLKDFVVAFDHRHDSSYLKYQEEDEAIIIKLLQEIPGLYSFSKVYATNKTIESIVETAIKLVNEVLTENDQTFKIETNRADKTFPTSSLEFTQTVAPLILNGLDKKVKVAIKKPKYTLKIDIRQDYAYLNIGQIKGMGGFPYGSMGKGLMLTSGGIDSPVASYLAIKQGIDVSLLHFESTPLTPLESVQKVIDIAKKLSKYTIDGKITLHLVPFIRIHQDILSNIPEQYSITIMRRMMYRIAEKFMDASNIQVMINGESVGQVASQTLESMNVVEAVTVKPILRPVITYDKIDIIELAKRIETFDISIRPFEDCCSIYVPKNPVTRPKTYIAERYEEKLDLDVTKTIENIITIKVSPNSQINLSDYGFDVQEAFQALGELKI